MLLHTHFCSRNGETRKASPRGNAGRGRMKTLIVTNGSFQYLDRRLLPSVYVSTDGRSSVHSNALHVCSAAEVEVNFDSSFVKVCLKSPSPVSALGHEEQHLTYTVEAVLQRGQSEERQLRSTLQRKNGK